MKVRSVSTLAQFTVLVAAFILGIFSIGTALADAPENSVPGPQATTVNVALTFSATKLNPISVTHPTTGNLPVQITLGVTGGVVSLSPFTPSTPFTFTDGDGTGDALMTFSGTEGDINGALDGLVFTPALDFVGDASLEITSNDLGHAGTITPTTDSDTVVITVVPGPLGLKQEAIAKLVAVQASLDSVTGVGDVEDADEEIEEAIEFISDSVDNLVPGDPLHLLDEKFFHNERHAVKAIFHAVDHGEITNTMLLDDLLDVIGKLHSADAIIAQVAIDDAIAAGGDPDDISDAQAEHAVGVGQVTACTLPPFPDDDSGVCEDAVKSFEDAWDTAQDAVEDEDSSHGVNPEGAGSPGSGSSHGDEVEVEDEDDAEEDDEDRTSSHSSGNDDDEESNSGSGSNHDDEDDENSSSSHSSGNDDDEESNSGSGSNHDDDDHDDDEEDDDDEENDIH